jgi:hypothetical protein
MSNPVFTDFMPLVDSTLIEAAVQDSFVNLEGGCFVAPLDNDDPAREKWTPGGGNIAIYTAFQNLVFQSCRPRVNISLVSASPYPSAYLTDANGVFRPKAWRGEVVFHVISDPVYLKHTQLRAKVLAILPTLAPLPTADGSDIAMSGVNEYLEFHEVAQFAVKDFAMHLEEGGGAYISTIPVDVTWGVRSDKWPGVNLSN